MIDKTLKLLICFILIVPLLGTKASANSNYNHDELMQYEGYGKAMYDTILEQSTFLTGQYTDNKDYVRNSMNEIKDYAEFWYNEYEDFTSSCYQNSVMNCFGEMTERGGAYVLTVGDWFKKLFSDYGTTIPNEGEMDYSAYGNFVEYSGGTNTAYMKVKSDYYVVIEGNDISERVNAAQNFGMRFMAESAGSGMYSVYQRLYVGNGNAGPLYDRVSVVQKEADVLRETFALKNNGLNGAMSLLATAGYNVLVYLQASNEVVSSGGVPRPNNVTNINNYLKDNPVQIPVPELKPTLVCPGGEKIQMSVSGSTFLGADGSVMLVDKDGTAELNGVTCNLNWEKPKVDYVDGKAAITDSFGNWLDIEKGDVLACLDPNGCELAPLDNSLLEYIKNAYNYATGVLKTATDGLKNLATGAKDLTSLFGTFFSWLPNEMVVLMASGLGITVGLRLFRK